MKVGSLFSGIGGFDLGFERAGFEIAWQVEMNKQCLQVLEDKYPGVPKYEDVTECYNRLPYADIVIGGDPCPKHSRARAGRPAAHPDLSGYFLAVVGRLRPEWVVRENVPASTVNTFALALESIGYGTVTVRVDAAEITGQSRPRDFVVGLHQAPWGSLGKMFSDASGGEVAHGQDYSKAQAAPCLTTHRTRHSPDDCWIFEHNRGIRLLDGDERCALAGLPKGYLEGFSEAAIARMTGNCVVPGAAYTIARVIQLSNLVEEAA